MLQELQDRLIVSRNFELVARFWDWYVLLRKGGLKGKITCYWDHDPDALGYAAPDRLWEVADDINKLDEQMRERGYPLSAIPLELWQEDTRPDVEVRRLEKVLSQHHK